MNWTGLVDLAGDLVGHDSEAAKRSAVNRAYYGIFNVARRLLEGHGISIADHRAHSQVWWTFHDAERATPGSVGKWRQVSDLGGTLRGLRNQADYDDVFPRLDQRAADAVVIAQRTLKLLEELEFS